MNKLRLLSIAERLKTLAVELENEVKADTTKYTEGLNVDYNEVLTYYNTQDDDGDTD